MHYGYVGLGNLGGHLAHSLVKKGYKVTVYDLDRSLAERHLKDGANWADSPAALAAQVDAVFTCLPSPTVSEKVLTQILTTLKPGSVPGRGNTMQAPHIQIAIFARGLMQHVVTRAYFAGEALNATDPVLTLVEDPARRATLIARPDGDGAWRLDIRLQGEGETVFLDV